MKEGIMVCDINAWRVWIGQKAYCVYEGMTIEIKFESNYLNFTLGKDYDNWFVDYRDAVTFELCRLDVYKVRVATIELIEDEDVF